MKTDKTHTDDDDDDNLGQVAFNAYAESVARNGYTLPRYIDLPMSIQENWQDVGEAIAKHLEMEIKPAIKHLEMEIKPAIKHLDTEL